ncbi:MAG: hypothetical protein NTY04_02675 [Candidatus Staskawiczbacteria bacterium]|nr:hypothetical protein [Candidatus Staskawiczbacteria bacterium]
MKKIKKKAIRKKIKVVKKKKKVLTKKKTISRKKKSVAEMSLDKFFYFMEKISAI